MFDHISQSGVDQPMPGEGSDATERLRNDAHPEVALAAGCCADVPGVQMAFILDLQLYGVEAALQSAADPLRAGRGLHRQLRPGWATRALPLSHNTCGIMNTSIAAVMPNTLKFTHTLGAKVRAT